MKRLLLRFGFLFGLVVFGPLGVSSCGTGTGGASAPVPSNRMARLSNAKMDDLNIGYETYRAHCIRCHTDRVPKAPLGRAWHPESLGMALYSSLSATQRFGVQEYLKAVEKARFKVDFGSVQDAR